MAEMDWHNITCEICHIPVEDSYYTNVSFWDQDRGRYQEVDSVMELCGKCHEGRHGFEVVEEQETSNVHAEMECTECHGAHGHPATCEDCHDPMTGNGASEHIRHENVNCTACHDAGNLSIWYDDEFLSPHYGEYIPRRFAHTLTSWPSHDLQTGVDCVRCHHPQGRYLAVVASKISCEVCHEDGAAIFWCENFPRDLEPNELQSGLP
ncbi:MAG TPA: cytochrome c3 family protein [Anaerolineales bacterium]|nr:cytochrome c3 family protein [Anaerolineales bacterium]